MAERTFDADLQIDDVPYSRYERAYLVLASTFVVALVFVLVLVTVIGI